MILKFIKKIKCLNDSKQLQEDLNNLFIWYRVITIIMTLNIDKNSFIFSKKKKPHYLLTTALITYLSRTNIINDLGVNFDSKLSFKYHVHQLINKSLMKLGLIKCMCSDFNDASALNILYYSLVRSKFEYASFVWHTDSRYSTK